MSHPAAGSERVSGIVIHTFLSWYSEDGTCGDIGSSFEPIEALLEALHTADEMRGRVEREKAADNQL